MRLPPAVRVSLVLLTGATLPAVSDSSVPIGPLLVVEVEVLAEAVGSLLGA